MAGLQGRGGGGHGMGGLLLGPCIGGLVWGAWYRGSGMGGLVWGAWYRGSGMGRGLIWGA